MFYGWAGAELEIDLSRSTVKKRATDRNLVETYLGGKGTNARLLWDRVPPQVDAFSPDNLLIIGNGVLTGTMVPSANHTFITFKSPVTGLLAYSAVGGFFGTALKHAGYDTVILSGKSSAPVYLWINDDRVELRDASHLWGKAPFETQRLIRQELKDDDVEVMCIGLAGENRVYAATIEERTGASASRAGPGAVMGDKKLKAIAVKGTKDISVADGARLVELSDRVLVHSAPQRKERIGFCEWVTAALVNTNLWAIGHFSGAVTPEIQQKVKNLRNQIDDFAKRFKTRDIACYNCPVKCKSAYPSPIDGHSITVKCQHSNAAMIMSQVIDFDYSLKFYSLCLKYGLDDISLANYIGFAIDLYQRGILTKKDTDGLDLEWGKPEVVFALIEKIARREGIGDVLADGVYRAARQIGKGAENYTYDVKKLEPLPYDVSGRPNVALPIATIDKADRTRGCSETIDRIWKLPRGEREAYIKAGYFQYPKEFEKYFLTDFDPSGADYEGMCQFNVYNEEVLALTDMTGLCFFWTNFGGSPPFSNRSLLADLISAATGMDIDEAEVTKMARRVMNLVRAYNVREGISRKDDSMPKIFFQKSRLPPYQQFDEALFNKWLDRYYEIKGWNGNGIPTGEILDELGLDYVRQDLEQRGILALPPVPVSVA